MRSISTRFIFALSSAALAVTPFLAASDADLSSKVDEYINAQMRANKFSGSILIAQHDRVLVMKGFGIARQGPDTQNTSVTKFRVGPITHQFTAMGILELGEEGKLDIQDSVCKYVTDCPSNWQGIKIINLLTHTSGISDFPGDETSTVVSTTFPGRLARFKSKPLEFKPGEKLVYSSFGYEVLGAVIEKASGEQYGKFVAEHIFAPLGMRDSGYDGGSATIPACADGYRLEGGSITVVAATCSDQSRSYRGSGGIYSSVEDLYRWDRALHEGELVAKKSLDQMFTPQRDGYGFGWRILKEFQKTAFVYGGTTNGFSASIRRYPVDDACVVVLSNLENVDAGRVSHDLASIILSARHPKTQELHTAQ
jgi:CubicO group peptidase (beta-lactamase class C family)